MKITQTETIGSKIITKGKLVLMQCKPEQALLFWSNTLGFSIYKQSFGLVKTIGKYLKPVIVSETEKLNVDDWHYKDVKKVLALPEQFSEETLQDIVEGNLKDGDEVYLECNIHEEWLKENPPFSNPKEHSKCYYQLELTSENHIILAEVEKVKAAEEKMVSLSLSVLEGWVNRLDMTEFDLNQKIYVKDDIEEVIRKFKNI